MHILCSGTPDEARGFLPYLVKEKDEAESVLETATRFNSDTFADQMRCNPILIVFWSQLQGSRLRLHHFTILPCNFADLSKGAEDVSEASKQRLQYTGNIPRSSFSSMRIVSQGFNDTISISLEEKSDFNRGSNSFDQGQSSLPPWTVVMRCLYPLICASNFKTVPAPIQQRTHALIRTLATDLRIQQASRARHMNDHWKMLVLAEWTLGCED